MEPNLSFLQETLTVDYVAAKVVQAAARLEGEPERDQARRIADDLPDRRELIALRVEELPRLLAGSRTIRGWSV